MVIGSGSLLALRLALLITMCVVKPVILVMISLLNPKTMATVKSMTEIPTEIPIIPIFTIGLEMLPLFCREFKILSAMNLSALTK